MSNAKPILDRNSTYIPDDEDFAQWCLNPVTKFVAQAFAIAAARQRDLWIANSWEGGAANEELLLELRVRADAYNAFIETTKDDYERIING